MPRPRLRLTADARPRVKHGYTPHIRARGEEIKLKPTPRLARPTLGRRSVPLLAEPQPALLIRWSKKDKNHLALLQLASGLIAFKKPAPTLAAANRDRP